MVVIVIMGILAAVAVPKLFGMIAKSKASEVGPAAGTYVKLQQAYFAEKVKYGTWTMIGYSGPGTNNATTSTTTNFVYDGTGITTESNAANQIGWKAKNVAKLNDCAGGTVHWQVKTKAATNDKDGYTVEMTNDANGACASLTPNFAAIGN